MYVAKYGFDLKYEHFRNDGMHFDAFSYTALLFLFLIACKIQFLKVGSSFFFKEDLKGEEKMQKKNYYKFTNESFNQFAMKKTVYFLLVVFLTSCIVTKDYVVKINKNKSISNSETKKVVVIATGKLKLKKFTKAFNKKYKSSSDFVKSYLENFTIEVEKNDVFDEIKIVGVNQLNHLKENSKADYIINFSSFEIINKFETRKYSGPDSSEVLLDDRNPIEYCVIKVNVKVFDVKNKNRILEFMSIGESSLFLFNYVKTLEKAKSRSITHVINYLKSGKVNYKKY